MERRKIILLAVRDAGLAAALRRAMGSAACDVAATGDGRQALREAKRLQPDVMVIDCVLPGLDGLAVMDGLRASGMGRLPRVIGGAMRGFAEEGFAGRGAVSVLRCPWDVRALASAVEQALCGADGREACEQADAYAAKAAALLAHMGMRTRLRGYAYLSYAAALACVCEERLGAIGEEIYRPVAARYGTTPQSVERLIRHAVESTMDAALARGMYGFFGNTIDPKRGKPTNAQAIAVLAERLRSDAGHMGNEGGFGITDCM